MNRQANPKESDMAAAAMADPFLESRVARLESDVAAIRSSIDEIKVDIRGLRTDVSDVRGEVHKLETSLRGEIADLAHKLTRDSAYTRIWMLLQSAALLGIMARAFKWL